MRFQSFGTSGLSVLRQMKTYPIAVTLVVPCLYICSFARAGSANSLPQAVPRLAPLGTQTMPGRRAVPQRCGPGGCGTTRCSSYFSFNGNDGAYPTSGVIQVNGALYGATNGQRNVGFVYEITTSGTESHVYDFRYLSSGDPADGA